MRRTRGLEIAVALVLGVALTAGSTGCDRARTEAISLVNQGVRALNRGDQGTAQSHFARAIRLDAKNPSAHYHLGLVELYHVEDPAKALIRFETAYQLAPDDVEVLFQLGRLQTEQGNAQAGLQRLDEAIALDPNHAPSWHFKGRALAALGQLADADKAYREAIAIDPSEVRSFSGLAELYEAHGAEEEARAVLRAGVKHNPVSADLKNALGALELRRGQYEQAVELFDGAHSDDPTRTDIIFNLAFAHAQSGATKKAIAHLQAFLMNADPLADKANMRIARALKDTLISEAAR